MPVTPMLVNGRCLRADQVSLELAEVDSGCLSDSAGGWPAFELDARSNRIDSISAFVNRWRLHRRINRLQCGPALV